MIVEDETITYDAHLSSASFVVRNGTVTDSNIGHPCTSGRLIDVTLIGQFPHVETTGYVVEPGQHVDFTVTAMTFTADDTSGEVCLVGVQTGDAEPEPRAVDLPLS